MNKIIIKLGAFALVFSANLVVAQEEKKEKVEQLEEVYLSDSRFELKKENSGKVIYKITQKDIKENDGKTVVDLLDNIAGVEINGNNNADGSNLGLYFRGGRNRQVAVMIDDVLVSDPTGIASTYNLNLLNVNQIESIEILKGSSSTLYGSGAATGVINIKLKDATKSPINFNYSTSIGTNNTQRNRKTNFEELNENIGIRGTLNNFSYLASYTISKSDGMSAANDKNELTPFENDKFLGNNGLVKFGYQISNNASVELFANYNKYKYDYDGGAYFDSDINNGYEEELRVGLKTNYKYNKGQLVAIFSKSDLERGFDSFNGWTLETDSYLYKGNSLSAEIINKYNITKKVQAILGINYQDFDNQTNTPFGNIDKDIANYSTIDPYLSAIYNSEKGFNLNVGVRLNNHSEYGGYLVYHVNPSYNVISKEDMKLKVLGSYSTAFIAPSTYQLFSDFGNLDLNPEENTTMEFGVDVSYKDWLTASSVFFYREEESTIIFVTDPTTFASQYENAVGTSYIRGVETAVNIIPTEKVNLNLTHTLTNKGDDLNYIPKNKFTARVSTTLIKNMNFAIGYKNVDERTYFDQYGSFGTAGEEVVLDTYNLIDLSANYTCNNVTFFALLDNAFNEDYEDVLGFSTRGRNVKLGLRLNF